MKSPNLDKYFDLRKKLLDLRSKHRDHDVYGTPAFIEEDKILDEMDDLWYKHLSDVEREYLNSAPSIAPNA